MNTTRFSGSSGIRMGVVNAVALAVLLLAGCTTMRGRKAEPKGFLGDYSALTKGDKGEAQLRWVDDSVDFSSYSKVILEPVTIWGDEDSKIERLKPKTRQALVDYFDSRLREEIGKHFELTQTSGPGTLRVRVAFVAAGASVPLLDTVSTVVPIGAALSVFKKAGSDKPLAVGEAAMEAEILDAITNRRVAAAVDQRLGTKIPGKRHLDRWGDVKDACDWWAKTVATRFADLNPKED